MAKKAAVKRMELPEGRRVLAVSDVHGNLPFLQGLLEKVRFTRDDVLLLLGDLVEKGPDSLSVLRYTMDLARTHTVHALCGNCDDLVVEFTNGGSDLHPVVFEHYLSVWKERSLISQMARAVGAQADRAEHYPALRELLRRQFAPELDFLRAMPTIIETPDYLFVHGGVPREDRLEELEAWSCMKNDNFLKQGYSFRRWCVVGHQPVTLYHKYIPDASPLLERERHIANIDGGCCLKLDGQLNALILPEEPGGEFTWKSFDGLETATALQGQAPSESSINIRWGRSQVEVLEWGNEFCRCRHKETGYELDILREFLHEREGVFRCEDATDYRLLVEPGDAIKIVREVTGGCLAKKNGVTGWYFGKYRRIGA